MKRTPQNEYTEDFDDERTRAFTHGQIDALLGRPRSEWRKLIGGQFGGRHRERLEAAYERGRRFGDNYRASR